MNNKKILITGADGQLAKSILSKDSFRNVFMGTKNNLDVTNRKQVLEKIEKFKPDFIFHFASITRGDECAKNSERAFLVNVEGTKNVVEAALKTGAVLVFVSTNEVFDGKGGKSYSEKDTPNPITVVGKTKFQAEKYIEKKMKRYYIVRTSWLYSKWSNNFIHTIFKLAEENKILKLVKDEVSSPTYSLDLGIAILKLIKTNKFGIYHLINEGSASRLEFAEKAFELSGKYKPRIEQVMLNDFPRVSKPPLYTPLVNKKGYKLGIVLPKWNNALKRYLKEEFYE